LITATRKETRNATEYRTCYLSGAVHTGGESLQEELRDVQTCGTTLASAYVLRCLSATWSQLQIIERSLRCK